ncbi:uncharacterized protein LOC135498706 [Lineus longissimus]|uniref:uncharacterized protein LOC135498706 n=1 Tax=Lineus longissimus TaxID=88925 RepID=UPI00315C8FD8
MAPKSAITCVQCEKSFSTKQSLVTHIRIHTGEKPFQCQYCEKSFSHKRNQLTHERIHTGEKPFQCKYCEKSFSSKKNQLSHERIHTGEKPFQCKYCEKSFSDKRNILNHERIHTGEKPFQCKYCEKSFSQTGHRLIHEHIHTGKKPFRCVQCEKSFVTKQSLEMHIRIHTGEKPFQCKYCEKSFSQTGHRLIHERIHTGEKPFRCVQCEKSFFSKQALVGHSHIHAGDEPFQLSFNCKYCHKTFKSESGLQKHRRSHNDTSRNTRKVSDASPGKDKRLKSKSGKAMKSSCSRSRCEETDVGEDAVVLTGPSNSNNSPNGQNPVPACSATNECLISREAESEVSKLPAAVGCSDMDIKDAAAKMTVINGNETVGLGTAKSEDYHVLRLGVKRDLIDHHSNQLGNVKSQLIDMFAADQSDGSVEPALTSATGQSRAELDIRSVHVTEERNVNSGAFNLPCNTSPIEQSNVKSEPCNTSPIEQSNVKSEPCNTSPIEQTNVKSEQCDMSLQEQGYIIEVVRPCDMLGNMSPSKQASVKGGPFDAFPKEGANVKSEPGDLSLQEQGYIIQVVGPCDIYPTDQVNVKSKQCDMSLQEQGYIIEVVRPCDISGNMSPVKQADVKGEPFDAFPKEGANVKSEQCDLSLQEQGYIIQVVGPCDIYPTDQANVKGEPGINSEPCDISPVEMANIKSGTSATSPVGLGDDMSQAGHVRVEQENSSGAHVAMSKIDEYIAVFDRWAEMLCENTD